MMSMAGRLASMALALFAWSCAAPQPTAVSTPEAPNPPTDFQPPVLHMLRGDIAFPMDLGSRCSIWGDEGVSCVDVYAPAYAVEMHTLVIGNTMELLFEQPFPDEVSASLHPVIEPPTGAMEIEVTAVMDENGRVLVTVPVEMEGNYVLVVFARWVNRAPPQGDAYYTTPVRFEG